MKVGDQPFRTVSEAEVRSVIAIQAYSQKQLSNVSVRVDELTRFVTAPVQARLADIEEGLRSTAAELRESYARVQRQRQLQLTIRHDELALESLAEQAAKLRQGISGVSDVDQKLLDQRAQYEGARQTAESFDRAASRAQQEAAELEAFLRRLLDDVRGTNVADLPHTGDLAEMQKTLLACLEGAFNATQAVGENIATLLGDASDYGRARTRWREGARSFDAQYAEASGRWREHEQRLNELSLVEQRQRAQSDAVAQAREQLRDLGDPERTYRELRKQWVSLRGDHMSVIEEQCAQLNELSDGAIRASVKEGSAVPELGEVLKAAIARSGVRATRIEALVEALAAKPEPLTVWEVLLNELEQLATFDPSDALAGGHPDTPTLAALGMPTADIERVATRLTPDGWLDLSLTQFTDKPAFMYRSREEQYIPFENASAGQQATALLHVLLRQHGPPLLIDQPEDDLDNEVVLLVAEQIGEAKASRQLVFASHDANLVVNGDADLVICCQYRIAGDHSGGRISHEGAIDVPDVREIITTVMEGGEKAFRLRTAKYGF
jgi:type III restriction enzyme